MRDRSTSRRVTRSTSREHTEETADAQEEFTHPQRPLGSGIGLKRMLEEYDLEEYVDDRRDDLATDGGVEEESELSDVSFVDEGGSSEEDEYVEEAEATIVEEMEAVEVEVPPPRPRRRPPPRPQMTRLERSRKYVEGRNKRLINHHPELETAWDDLLELSERGSAGMIEQPEELKLHLLPFQREGVAWMLRQEETMFAGGILADEMGMGKTIQTIALILEGRKARRIQGSAHEATLIVAPAVALIQWKNEIAKHTEEALQVHIFHGGARTQDRRELEKYDVVLTTYSIVERGFRAKLAREKAGTLVQGRGRKATSGSILQDIAWNRIILDEAHMIKERSTTTARAAFALEGRKKWSLTGTPLQNRVGELYSLLRFNRVDPFAHYYCTQCPCKRLTWKFEWGKACTECGHSPMSHVCWWNVEILKPIQKFGGQLEEGREAFEKLGRLLRAMMLRRTKVERADDLGLPPRHVQVRRDMFSAEEADLYQSLYRTTRRRFTTYVEEGTVLSHYATIFELLGRMRQAADHPELLRAGRMRRVGAVCGICHEEPEDGVMSRCRHIFCREDARQYMGAMVEGAPPLCPTCSRELEVDLEQKEVKLSEDGKRQKQTSIVSQIDMGRWRSSTKMEALVEELSRLRGEDVTVKSIVFSQYVNFLDLIQWRLGRAGFRCCRIDGKLPPLQRDAVIQRFNEDPALTVFLISLKAGGVALNLTEASHVFLCDPWWNPAVEDQAMDRIHRLGQYRPIQIHRLIIEDSIESKILALQEKKRVVFAGTIGQDSGALARLTEEDLQFLFVM